MLGLGLVLQRQARLRAERRGWDLVTQGGHLCSSNCMRHALGAGCSWTSCVVQE